MIDNGSETPFRRAGPSHPWDALLVWLRRVPIADPMDRRNAPMLQMVLAFMGVLQPLALLRSLLAPATFAFDPLVVALSILNTLLVWGCFLLVRRGKFKLAAHMFIGGSLALLAVGYARWGLEAQLRYQVSQVYPVLIGGLLLNRRVLWLSVAALCAIVLTGAGRDLQSAYYESFAIERALDGSLRSLSALLIIGVILDRAVTALRASLERALDRGNRLASTRDRLQLEMQEKERAREQLIHAQKVEAAGRLASGIAHDFNHLLGLILAYAGRGRRLDEPEALKQALAGVESAARRASAVSRKLLNFSRQDDTCLELFDPAAALQEMKPMLGQLFDPAVQLQFDLDELPHRILFDRAQFELVVLNIAANADQAMPDGGSFRLSLYADLAAAQTVIEFADTGVGMAPEVRARIFEPFFTTKPAGEGTGLGLAVAKDLVESVGGTLAVHSAAGAGTTFRIALPWQA